MAAKCQQFNRVWGLDLRTHHYRDLYKVEGVSNQQVRSRLGRPVLKPRLQQEMELQIVKNAYAAAERGGYECMQLDEVIFQADTKRPKAWARKREPLRTRGKYSNKPVICVCGAISALHGGVYFKFGYRSFNGLDMADMYKQIRLQRRPADKLMVFLDNCSIHKSGVARDAAKRDKANLWL